MAKNQRSGPDPQGKNKPKKKKSKTTFSNPARSPLIICSKENRPNRGGVFICRHVVSTTLRDMHSQQICSDPASKFEIVRHKNSFKEKRTENRRWYGAAKFGNGSQNNPGPNPTLLRIWQTSRNLRPSHRDSLELVASHPSYRRFPKRLSISHSFRCDCALNVAGNGRHGRTFWIDCTLRTCVLSLDALFGHPIEGVSGTLFHNSRKSRRMTVFVAISEMRLHNHKAPHKTMNVFAGEGNFGVAPPRFCF